MRISDWSSDLCSSDLDRHVLYLRFLFGDAFGELFQILAAGRVEIAKTGTTKREQAIFGPDLDLARLARGRHRVPGCHDIIRRSRGGRTLVGIPVRRLGLVLFVKLDLILAAEQAAARRRWQAEDVVRSEEHTSELQSLMRISYAFYCLKN